jgi:hypothetical protein
MKEENNRDLPRQEHLYTNDAGSADPGGYRVQDYLCTGGRRGNLNVHGETANLKVSQAFVPTYPDNYLA